MKAFRKMTKKEVCLFILMALASGFMIGLGGTASLWACALYGAWGKIIGAVLFSLGIYAIVTYEMRLFTGMVAGIPKMGFKNFWQLPVCFLGNVFGVAFIALLVYALPIANPVVEQAKLVIATKTSTEYWGLTALCSSILCGALITLSVWSVKYAPKKGLSSTLGVIFPIVVFAFCGFDHSVANILYFILNGVWTWQLVGYEFVCFIGNILGGIILPLISLLKEKSAQYDTSD